jgi:hypothetical protein
VSPVRYKLGSYILEDAHLRSYCRDILKFYIALTGWTLQRRRNMSPMKYELGFYIAEDGILHSQCREHRKSYIVSHCFPSCRPVFSSSSNTSDCKLSSTCIRVCFTRRALRTVGYQPCKKLPVRRISAFMMAAVSGLYRVRIAAGTSALLVEDYHGFS